MVSIQPKKQVAAAPANARTYLLTFTVLVAVVLLWAFTTHGGNAHMPVDQFSRAAAALNNAAADHRGLLAGSPAGLFGSDSLKKTTSSSPDSDLTKAATACDCGKNSLATADTGSHSSSNSSGASSATATTTTSSSSSSLPREAIEGPQHEMIVPDLQGYSGNVLYDVAKRVLQLEREGKGRKVISMSLYGNDTRYTYGAVENALMVRRGWPGWTLRLYVGEGVPDDILQTVRTLGAEVVSTTAFQSKASSLMWRFFVMGDRTVTRFIVRDADARLTPRDYYAVKEWTASNHLFSILRDDYFHGNAIMGGMWGAVNGLIHPRILQPYKVVEANTTKGDETYKWNMDQVWLGTQVFPHVKNVTLLHASWHCKKYGEAEWRGFPTQRVSDRDFVGNVYWGMNDFQGRTCSGVCPEECRRRAEWTNC